MNKLHHRLLIVFAAWVLPAAANAHSFGRLYTLPVPFWLYGWGAAATLIVSFVLIALFLTGRDSQSAPIQHEFAYGSWLRRIAPARKRLSVLLLLLTIATALIGHRDPYRNFGMIGFWIMFVLGVSYLTALTGNVYARFNPWRALVQGIGKCWRGFTAGRMPYPQRLGDWPALLLYLAFIGFELFGTGKPLSLGMVLLAYTALNLFGVWLFGAAAWFKHCELFALFLRLIGKLAPVVWRKDKVLFRSPFSAVWTSRPSSVSTVVFVLAMLSTTAFDGLSATQSWVNLFWADPYRIVESLLGDRPMNVLAEALPWYFGWQTFWLVASPFLYFAAYSAALALAKWWTGTQRTLRELVLDFGYSLLPIALVYHVTHYATLLLSDGLKIISLFSDPFGWGWNLFGTAWKFRAPILPDLSVVWHGQVALILIGHIASVYAAHRIALKVFLDRKQAALSQLPMLLLMVAFTIFGLWIIAQPLTTERMM